MIGKRRDELSDLINRYKELVSKDNEIITRLNKRIVELQEENRQQAKLIGLYEACINKGIQVDFPNVTGKGGKTVQNGSKGFNADNIKY